MKKYESINPWATALLITAALLFYPAAAFAGDQAFEKDTFNTGKGKLEITFIGHGSLMLAFEGTTVQVDPWSRLADYSLFPDADLILITHEHGDHLDLEAIHHARKEHTQLVFTELCSQKVSSGIIMKNGDTREVDGIRIEAVPAYNIRNKRPDGSPFHPRGDGNGYVLTFGDDAIRVYIAGDTENIPEMANLQDIDIAFLPMNLPYTMDPEMVAEAARSFRPGILYPYHFGNSDTKKIIQLLDNEEDIEVRIRNME